MRPDDLVPARRASARSRGRPTGRAPPWRSTGRARGSRRRSRPPRSPSSTPTSAQLRVIAAGVSPTSSASSVRPGRPTTAAWSFFSVDANATVHPWLWSERRRGPAEARRRRRRRQRRSNPPARAVERRRARRAPAARSRWRNPRDRCTSPFSADGTSPTTGSARAPRRRQPSPCSTRAVVARRPTSRSLARVSSRSTCAPARW